MSATWPLAARAQQSGKLPTIGFLGSGTPAVQSLWVAAFVKRLRELGWIDGRNIAIEYRWAEGSSNRAAELATEFILLKVDVIVTYGSHYQSHQRQGARPRSTGDAARACRRGDRVKRPRF